jgi:uncharacterized DUF497 family protein
MPGGDYFWDEVKNQSLRSRRGTSFEEIVRAITEGELLDDRENPTPAHQGQRVLIVRLKGYTWAVPYRFTVSGTFLITAFPSRKLNREYAETP